MTSEQPESLERQVRKGLRWSFASNVLSRVTTLIVGIMLARLLSPQDYGEFSVALVALVILVNINDLGVEQSLVRWPGSLERVAPTATTVIFGFSVLLYAVCFFGAGPFARALGAPSAAPIVQVMAFGLVINGAFAVPSAVLTRHFRQDRRTLADFTGFLLGTGITVVLALMGYGAWSLAIGRVVGNATVSLMHVVLVPVRFRPGWDPAVARTLVRASLPLGGASVVAVTLLNVDYIVVGRMLGTEQLGYYTLAFNLASWPVTFFAVAVARVSVPAFAQMQFDPARLQAAYERSSSALLAATIPVSLLLAVFADPLVRFVYGDKWAPAVGVLRLLAILGLLRVLYQFWADVLIAVGSGRRVLVTQLCWLISLPPLLVWGTRWGLEGIGAAHVVCAIAVVAPIYAASMRGVVRLRSTARALLALGVVTAVAAAAALPLLAAPLNIFWTLALGTPLMLLVYGLGVALVARHAGIDTAPISQAGRRVWGLGRRAAHAVQHRARA